MGRHLAAALAQYPPITGVDPVGQLAAQVAEILGDSARLDLIVFPPEIHLCGDCDAAPPDANDWLRAAAEPLDGPRIRALGEVARQLGGCGWIPGSVPELRAGDRGGGCTTPRWCSTRAGR